MVDKEYEPDKVLKRLGVCANEQLPTARFDCQTVLDCTGTTQQIEERSQKHEATQRVIYIFQDLEDERERRHERGEGATCDKLRRRRGSWIIIRYSLFLRECLEERIEDG